jgi:hypothetical protein
MDFVPTLALAALIYQTVNLLRSLRGRDWNTTATVAIAWIAGAAAVWLVAQTDFADGIQVGDLALSTLNAWSLLFVGMTVGSVGSVTNDVIGAVDNTRSTVKPPLLP